MVLWQKLETDIRVLFVLVGVTALSEFHVHFLDSLQALTRKCVSKRDALMKQLLEGKDTTLTKPATTTADNETVNSSEQEKPSGGK